jgi:hypothetical protein
VRLWTTCLIDGCTFSILSINAAISCTELFPAIVEGQNYTIIVFHLFLFITKIGNCSGITSVINIDRKLYKNSKHMGRNISKLAAAAYYYRRTFIACYLFKPYARSSSHSMLLVRLEVLKLHVMWLED